MSHGYHHHDDISGWVEAGVGMAAGFFLFHLFLLSFVLVVITMWIVLAKHPTIRHFFAGLILLLAVASGLFIWAVVSR